MRIHQDKWKLCILICAMGSSLNTWANFIEDSQVNVKLRNFYLDRQYADAPHRNIGSWSQSMTLDAKSGYTHIGSLQLGVDLLAQYAVRLNGRDQNPDWVLPYHGRSPHGKQDRDFGKIGATLKAKVSQTELRVGELVPMTPVLFFDPSRQLLTTYNGIWLESKEIEKTKITLGYIESINARYENQAMDLGLWPKGLKNDGQVDGMYVAGIDYQINPAWSASYFYGDVDNIYRQNYVALNHKAELSESSKINSHVRVFDHRESGEAIYGKMQNQALSAAVNLSYQRHSFGISYQQMFGEHGENTSAGTGFPYFPSLAGWAPQPYLDNWSVAAFIRKDEKSVGVNYSYDFKGTALNGLKATAKYWYGWDVDTAYESAGTKSGHGKEQEWNFILNYVVPEGKLKGVGLQWMYIDVDFENIQGQNSDLVENRIAATYSYKF